MPCHLAGNWRSSTRATPAGSETWRWPTAGGRRAAGAGQAGGGAGGLRRVSGDQPASGRARPEQRRLAARLGGGPQPGRRRAAGAGQAGGGAGGLRRDLWRSAGVWPSRTRATPAGSVTWRWRTAGWATCLQVAGQAGGGAGGASASTWRSAGDWPSRTRATPAGSVSMAVANWRRRRRPSNSILPSTRNWRSSTRATPVGSKKKGLSKSEFLSYGLGLSMKKYNQ